MGEPWGSGAIAGRRTEERDLINQIPLMYLSCFESLPNTQIMRQNREGVAVSKSIVMTQHPESQLHEDEDKSAPRSQLRCHHDHAFCRRQFSSFAVNCFDENDVGTDTHPLAAIIKTVPNDLSLRSAESCVRERPD
jgi:hypothetical protein